MSYYGKVTMGDALGSSLNIPAVKLLHEVGVDRFYDLLRDVGTIVGTDEKRQDDPSQYGLALSLGVKEISPLDFTRMRTIFSDVERPTTARNERFFQRFAPERAEVLKILSNNTHRLLSFPLHNRFDMP